MLNIKYWVSCKIRQRNELHFGLGLDQAAAVRGKDQADRQQKYFMYTHALPSSLSPFLLYCQAGDIESLSLSLPPFPSIGCLL